MNPISKTIYKKTDQKLQKWHKILNIVMVKVPPVLANIPMFIISFYTYFTTDLGRDAFELPCPAWFPFDWKNPTGYSVAVVIQTIFLYNVLLNAKCLSIFIIGTCLMLISLTKDIKYDLHSITYHRQIFHGNQLKTERKFYELIQFFSNARQLSSSNVQINR